MIQQESKLKVADNSGAKTVKCIKVLGGYKKKYAKLSDIIIVSVRELRNKSKQTSKVKKGEIYRALIIRTKKKVKKKDGSYIACNTKSNSNKNCIVLINKKGNPIGTRVTEPLPINLKKKQHIKISNISQGII